MENLNIEFLHVLNWVENSLFTTYAHLFCVYTNEVILSSWIKGWIVIESFLNILKNRCFLLMVIYEMILATFLRLFPGKLSLYK